MRPHQVPALNKGFTPTDEEIAQAESVLTACTATRANGGARVPRDGTVIDAARAAIAANLIAWAEACKKREQGRATVVAQTPATAQPRA
jgi:citrate lyase subunit beta/citryl-CoA lyase